MSLPKVSLIKLLESGVHFGHNVRRWNPKMAQYIFGAKNKVHIIDLDKTVPLFEVALKAVYDVAASGGRILFVGTKRQASAIVADAAKKCGQYYVNHRWLGGMLTNWKTVSQSLKKLAKLEERLQDTNIVLKKKEILTLERETGKLERALGGVREMGGIPSMLFVIDTIAEKTAIEEAKKLGIPIVAICDTNSDPDSIDYIIPGNDDSLRAIELYCACMVDTIIDGIKCGFSNAGVDIGSLDDSIENILEEGDDNVTN